MTPREFKTYRSLLILILLVPMLLVAVERAVAMPVEYNPEGSPVPLADMEPAVQYALWTWTSRLDIDAHYSGLTTEREAKNEIIIVWESFPFFNDDGSINWTLGRANWWSTVPEGKLTRAVIRLNTNWRFDKPKVDACLRELLAHELGHVFSSEPGHSDDPRDVMYADQGECRYTPSVSDLAMMAGKVKSCDVELTPDGALEYADYRGQRVQLLPVLPRVWEFGSVYRNEAPSACSAVSVDRGTVTANVMEFGKPRSTIKLMPVDGRYVSFKP